MSFNVTQSVSLGILCIPRVRSLNWEEIKKRQVVAEGLCLPLVCATKILQWLISSWLNSCFCKEKHATGTRGKQKTGSVIALPGQTVLDMLGAWCCLEPVKPVTGLSSSLLGTFPCFTQLLVSVEISCVFH